MHSHERSMYNECTDISVAFDTVDNPQTIHIYKQKTPTKEKPGEYYNVNHELHGQDSIPYYTL